MLCLWTSHTDTETEVIMGKRHKWIEEIENDVYEEEKKMREKQNRKVYGDGIYFIKGAIAAVIAIGIFLFVISLFGCGAIQIEPHETAATCERLQEHLVEVGCFYNEKCHWMVQEIVEKNISTRIPESVDFDVYCDIALMSGLLPLDCLMEATTIAGVRACVE
jgi:hypothetical protein